MTMNEKMEIADRLIKRIPLLDKYHPPGWVDFRSPLPAIWRAGLFLKLSDKFAEFEDNPEDLGRMRFKAMFGGVKNAVAAASAVSELTGKAVQVNPPHSSELDCDGVAQKVTVPYWTILFEMEEQEVCW